MPKFEAKRERRRFRIDFGDDGRIAKFAVAEPSGMKADCCVSCAGSDQNAFVEEASDNAKHLLGLCSARDRFLKHETKDVFTDGTGFISGVLVRDLC